eukprot:GHVU01185193.1.p1 GENE.GHVU01185193.1~~GHVU01185193.1.p1  ORF type:complete len:127 (-),score=4.81 GHVU01185193.1:366-746(-)
MFNITVSVSGVNESPMMTWGEIEGTPFRLDGSDTPVSVMTPGPAFRIPNVPKRDRLAMELAEKASKSHRAKKEEALQQVNRLKTYVPISTHMRFVNCLCIFIRCLKCEVDRRPAPLLEFLFLKNVQ